MEQKIQIKQLKHTDKVEANRILCVAPSNYGKSAMISRYLIEQVKEKHYDISRILIFSPTHKSDPSQQQFIQFCEQKRPGYQKANCYENIREDVIMHIYNTNKQLKDMGMPIQHFMFWFDDSIADQAMTSKKGMLQLVATTGRHYFCSSIISIQAYRSTMNSTVRSQMSSVCIGRLLSIGEVEDLSEQYNQGLGSNSKEAKKKFIEIWEQAIQMNDNHGFLIIWTYRQFGQKRIQMGDFNGPFYDD